VESCKDADKLSRHCDKQRGMIVTMLRNDYLLLLFHGFHRSTLSVEIETPFCLQLPDCLGMYNASPSVTYFSATVIREEHLPCTVPFGPSSMSRCLYVSRQTAWPKPQFPRTFNQVRNMNPYDLSLTGAIAILGTEVGEIRYKVHLKCLVTALAPTDI
jgi:hypothetical protein